MRGRGRFDRLSDWGGWAALRDERGKLRAKWDPSGRVLEIQERGEVARWRVGADGNISLDRTRAG